MIGGTAGMFPPGTDCGAGETGAGAVGAGGGLDGDGSISGEISKSAGIGRHSTT